MYNKYDVRKFVFGLVLVLILLALWVAYQYFVGYSGEIRYK